MGKLILVRHGESLWNAKNVWTGLTDIDLSPVGCMQAKAAAQKLSDLSIDLCYTSNLVRSIHTAAIILEQLDLTHLDVIRTSSLNERDYGDLTGKDKNEVKKEIGEEAFKNLRRGFLTPIPNGESLSMVYDRVVSYYQLEIEPLLKSGHNILIVAHGNSLRALVKYLRNLTNEEVAQLEIATGEVLFFEFN